MTRPIPMLVPETDGGRKVARLVPVREIPAMWHTVRDNINRALAEGDGNFAEIDILNGLLIGREWFLWVAGESALVCQIVQFPRKKVCFVIGTGGDDMGAWLPQFPALESWAYSVMGCDRIEALGRAGWIRVLKPYGWEQRHFHVSKHLGEER